MTRAAVLGISRSTTWNVLSGAHKASGLSASVIIRMLAAPNLKPTVRAKILEYVGEKSRGNFGGAKQRLRKFVGRVREHDFSRSAIESSKSGVPQPLKPNTLVV